jgi:hypothetical protein
MRTDTRVTDSQEAARRMLARYTSPHVAEEMAHWHACDYAPGDWRRGYWERVKAEIQQATSRKGER